MLSSACIVKFTKLTHELWKKVSDIAHIEEKYAPEVEARLEAEEEAQRVREETQRAGQAAEKVQIAMWEAAETVQRVMKETQRVMEETQREREKNQALKQELQQWRMLFLNIATDDLERI